MRTSIIFAFLFASYSSLATTLVNVEPINVVEESDRVLHIKVIEAEFLEYELEDQELVEIPTCGTNVKARVIYDYLGFEQEVEFSTLGEIEVGTEYLVFLKSISSEKWYKGQMWGHFFTPSELDKSTIRCLSKINELKSDSFPQRAIKINYEKYLVFELNNMLIPVDVKIKNSGESGVIMQYNQTLVLFSDFDKYLRELIRSNKPLKVDAK